MSPTYDWTSLIAGTAFGVFWRIMDFVETRYGINKLGTEEENDFLTGKGGKMAKWVWPALLGPIALAWIIFFAFDETEHWDRVYCGGLAAIGGIVSMAAYFSNRNLHRKIRERGGRPSAGVGVPGGTKE